MTGRISTIAAASVVVLAFAGPALAAARAEAPMITKFTPTTAKITHSVTIDGKYFTGVKTVKVDGMAMTFKVDSSSKIVATLSSKAKTGKITVTTKGGTTTSKTKLNVT